MKSCLWIAASCALCGLAWAAPVNFSDPYVELSAGAAMGSDLAFDGVSTSLESGPAAGIGFGFASFIGPLDLRLDYYTTDRDSCFLFCALGNQGVTSSSAMLSALYNFPVTQDRWDAYVGAGAGFVKVDAQHTGFSASENYSGSDNVFGGQLIGGTRVKLFNGPISLVFEYRYQGSKDAKVEGHTVEYKSNSFTGGVRWTF